MSTVRLRRLRADYENLSTYVRQHPRLGMIQFEGDPPEKYQIEYQIKSLRMANGERIEPHVGEYVSGRHFTRYYWQLELDEQLRPTGRDIVAPPGPPSVMTMSETRSVCDTSSDPSAFVAVSVTVSPAAVLAESSFTTSRDNTLPGTTW